MANERQALFYALSAVLLWSTVATAFKIALSHQPVVVLLAGASLTSCATFAAILLVQGRLASAFGELRDSLGRILILATINPVLYYLILFEAYRRLPAQVAQPVNYTNDRRFTQGPAGIGYIVRSRHITCTEADDRKEADRLLGRLSSHGLLGDANRP